MTYPTNPTNGQQANINGVVYTYNSTKGVWAVTTTFSGNALVDQINANAVVSAGNVAGTNFNGGTVSVTGNITGANLNATNFNGTAVSVSGNVAATNLNITGNIVDTGAISIITGSNGNINLSPNGSGLVSATNKVSVAFDGTANLTNADNMLELVDNGVTSTPSMAFHRPAAYATKITLNTDNALYFGGWSAAAGGATIVSGTHNPGATNTYDLGTASLRWRNIFTQDLQLNNGIGDYTIVEGEDDLFLYNNKKRQGVQVCSHRSRPCNGPSQSKYGLKNENSCMWRRYSRLAGSSHDQTGSTHTRSHCD